MNDDELLEAKRELAEAALEYEAAFPRDFTARMLGRKARRVLHLLGPSKRSGEQS